VTFLSYGLTALLLKGMLGRKGVFSSIGAVTQTEFGRLNIGEPDSDSGRGGGSPRPEGSSRRTRSVRRDVRWRWTLKVFWTAA